MRRWVICIVLSLLIHCLVLILPIWPSLPEYNEPSRVYMVLDLLPAPKIEAAPGQNHAAHTEPRPVRKEIPKQPSPKKEKPVNEPVLPVSPGKTKDDAAPAMQETERTQAGSFHEAEGKSPSQPVPRVVSAADVVRRVSPVYPMISRRRGEEGEVSLLISLDPAGKVLTAEVMGSSGHPSLDASALEAVRKWLFTPGSPEKLIVPVIFRLE